MPQTLVDQSVMDLNVGFSAESLAPENVVATISRLQDEINRYNRQLMTMLITSLGASAYTDAGGGETNTHSSEAGGHAITAATPKVSVDLRLVALATADFDLSADVITIDATKWAQLSDISVTKVGTPVNNEIGVWTGDGTLEGDSNFVWDGSTLTIVGNTFINSVGDSYSRIGPDLDSISPNNPVDNLVVSMKRIDGGSVRRALYAVAEIVDGLTLGNFPTMGINGFVYTLEGATVDSTRTALQGGLCGGRYGVRHEADGTLSKVGGVASSVEIRGANEDGFVTDGYAFLDEGGDGGDGDGAMERYHGLWIKEAVGNINNKNGIWIEDLEDAAVTNVGIKLDGASTYAIWLNNDSGAANDGISAGASGDTNLYRSAADEWTTDDSLIIKKDLFFISDGSGIPYGGMYTNTQIVVSISDTNPTEVGDTWITGEVNLITFGSSHYLTVVKAGRYKIDWSMSVEQDTPSPPSNEVVCEGGIMIGGAAQAPGRASTWLSAGEAPRQHFGGTAILDLAASAQISLYVADLTDSEDIAVENANVTVTMVGGT